MAMIMINQAVTGNTAFLYLCICVFVYLYFPQAVTGSMAPSNGEGDMPKLPKTSKMAQRKHNCCKIKAYD